MQLKMNFKVHEVRGDGHCFFRSVAQALRVGMHYNDRSMEHPTEDESVIGLRHELARLAKKKYLNLLRKMMGETLSLCYPSSGDPVDCFLSSTPIDIVMRRGRGIDIDSYAKVLAETNAFASFIEVELMRRFLKRRGIALVVVPSTKSLYSAVDWTARLRKINVRKQRYHKMLVLVNHDGAHYSWASVNSQPLFDLSF